MSRKEEILQAWEKLRAGFVSHDILDAVDYLDKVRPIISDNGYRPPKIRDKLLKLHGIAMELITYTGREDAKRLKRLLLLADTIEEDVYDCIKNLEKINHTISKLVTLGSNEDWPEDDEDEDQETSDWE